jgi:hypothetical protein
MNEFIARRGIISLEGAQITGSLSATGNISSTTLTVTGGITGTATSASYVEYSNVANKPALISGSSQVSYTGLSNTPSGIVSGSAQITYSGISSIPAGIVSSSAQVGGYGIFATTGSNTFQANQIVTGSLFITQNLVVAGSSSIQYISSSVLDIADNTITVNTFNPSIRFGGLGVIDSGSSPQVSGSILFDSVRDQWIFVHQNPTVVTSSVVLMGPETYNDLGNESYISSNRLPKGSGVEHLRDSNISDTGTVVSVNSNTAITGSFTVVSGSAVELQVTNLGVNIGSALTDSHIISGSLRVNPNGLFVSGSGAVGIGTTSPDVFSRGDERNVGISVPGASDNLALALNAGGSAGRGAQIYMGQGGTRHLTISSNATETRVGTTTSTPLILTTNDTTRLTIAASTGAATFSSSVTANSLLVERTVSRNMLGISSTSLPTSGDEEGVAVIKTNSSIWQLSTVGYATDSKGVRFYNNGGTGYTAFEVAQAGGTRFIVNGAGNVGIGTASPGAKLDINGGDLYVRTGGGVYANTLGSYSGNMTISLGGSGNNLIVSGGNVGIGTASPQTTLSIETSGVQSTVSPIITGQSSGITYGGIYTIRDGAGDQRGLIFQNYTANVGLTEKMRITSGGNVLINNTSDDSSGAKLQVNGRVSQADYTYYRNRVAGNLTGATWINTGVTLTANNLGTYEVYVLGNENNQNQCLRIYYVYYNTNIGWTATLAATHIQPTGNDYGVVNLRMSSGGTIEVNAANSISTGLYRIVVTKQFQN